MSKKVVPLVTGETYHVYNRGVDKRDIYIDKFDYLRFYQSLLYFNTNEPTLNFSLAKHRHAKLGNSLVEIVAYCLLPNHFHFILKQTSSNGISEFMKRIGAGYTGYFNEKYERSGALFQGVYKRVHISDEEQFNYLFSYVNENHTVHNLTRGSDIFYSSSLHYQGKRKSNVIVNQRLYKVSEAIMLAKDIYTKREQYKNLLE